MIHAELQILMLFANSETPNTGNKIKLGMARV
jgi:hypothetical protein